jgi:hypothetical protein
MDSLEPRRISLATKKKKQNKLATKLEVDKKEVAE